ncbi:F-box domain-containing protein [Favolaschia claudopus]|uniref:F-box domain-containing protein n=1 Tax=Favolaschia claudopus TaxID=2862362 RepID=A0AAW0D6B9_9AGAR
MSSPANSLPDEIISEILAPALRITDAQFSDLRSSRFMKFSESSSAYLLVCKSWLRVATPLLYGVIPLRSRAQAQALAAALTSNPELGRFIKRLRVEGGYGISMDPILQSAKNISHLCLSLHITHSDSASGLCRGLPLLSPVHLILDGGRATNSQPIEKLIDVLEKCLLAWTQLVQSFLSSIFIVLIISDALAKAPALETLVIGGSLEATRVPPYLHIVAENPTLKDIRITWWFFPNSSRQTFYNETQTFPRLRSLVHLSDQKDTPNGPLIEPELNSFVYPAQLAADPAQEDAIWSRILFFATQLTNHYHWDVPFSQRIPRTASLYVCKLFARVGTPHIYKHIRLAVVRRLPSFLLQVSRQPSLGHNTRSLHLNHDANADILKIILPHLPSLVTLQLGEDAPMIPWKSFAELSELMGPNLQILRGMRINKASGSATPRLFSLYTQMRELSWDSGTKFKTEPRVVLYSALNNLVKLTIDNFDESLLGALARMDLPVLRGVTFYPFRSIPTGGAEFFQKHGPKLTQLTLCESQLNNPELAIWRNCPMVTTLGVACDKKHPVNGSWLATFETHPFLETIVFVSTSYIQYQQQQSYQNGNGGTTPMPMPMTPLLSVLSNCILTWKRLTQLEMPLYFALGKISKALNQAPHLNSLIFWNRHDTRQLPTRIRKLSEAPTLARIQIRDSNHSMAHLDEILSDAFAAEPRLSALVTVASER